MPGIFHPLPGDASLDSALAGVEEPEDETTDVAEDCVNPCWRHGGDHPCTCGGDDDDEGTTEGGW